MFSAQIVSAPIWCSLTVQLFRVRVWIRISQKALNIGTEKVRTEMVAPKSRGPLFYILFIPYVTKEKNASKKLEN